MNIDPKVFRSSIDRKRGLLDKLGGAGRFLTELVRGECTAPRVKSQIAELERYRAKTADEIEEIGREWEKVEFRLREIKGDLKEAGRPRRMALLAQAEILFRQVDGYEETLNQLKRNGLAAEVLVEKLRGLLVLLSGPMSEDDIDRWTSELEEAIEQRSMEVGALSGMQELDLTAGERTGEKMTAGKVLERLGELDGAGSAPEKETPSREQAVEDRLNELFEE